MHAIRPDLILASASPRRRQLLEEAGYAPVVEPADVDEEALAAGCADVRRLPQFLAEIKADPVAQKHAGQAVVVLAADTVVYSDTGEVLGKPRDRAHAEQMMRTLAGTLHQVVTGWCCQRCDDGRRLVGQVRSDVMMRPLSDLEITRYLNTGDWEGKAGGYGIQDTPGAFNEGDRPFIERISGELTNIVGLPMPQVIEALGSLGVDRHDPLAGDGP